MEIYQAGHILIGLASKSIYKLGSIRLNHTRGGVRFTAAVLACHLLVALSSHSFAGPQPSGQERILFQFTATPPASSAPPINNMKKANVQCGTNQGLCVRSGVAWCIPSGCICGEYPGSWRKSAFCSG